MSQDTVTNQRRARQAITATESKNAPDWGPFPPRRLRKAKAIWGHMKNSGTGLSLDGSGEGPWFTAEMVYVWYNANFRYDITVNWLANVFVRNRGAFVKGPSVRVNNGISAKVVALWRAV